MRNLKKILAAIIVLAMMVTVMVPALAETTTLTNSAEAAALKDLGLTTISSTDASLGAKLTRQSALSLALKIGGLSATCTAISSKTALADLKPLFADTKSIATSLLGYVDYGVSNGFVTVKGTKGEKFNPGAQVKGAEFAAMIWKALGYTLDDEDANIAASKLADLGAFSSAYSAMAFSNKKMTKGDAVTLAYAALKTQNIDGVTQVESLIKNGVVTKDAAIAAGVYSPVVDTKPEGATFWQDFESGSIDKAVWSQILFDGTPDPDAVNGVWSVTDTGDKYNTKQLHLQTAEGQWSMLRAGDLDWYNGTLEGTIVPTFDAEGSASLNFRTSIDATGARSLYNFRLEDYQMSFKRYGPSGASTLWSDPVNKPLAGNVYKIKMVFTDGRIVGSLNGKQIFDVTDANPLPAGNISVGSWAEAPNFDSISFIPAPGVPAPATISTVSAGVNQLVVALDKTPVAVPKKADFVITKTVGTDAAVAVKADSVSFDLNKTFTFTLPASTDAADKVVTYSVSYLGQTAVSAGTVKTVLEAKNIGYSATVTAVNATAAKFQLFNGTNAVSAVAALGTATPVFGAKAGDVLTVKVFKADGTTLVATSSVTVA